MDESSGDVSELEERGVEGWREVVLLQEGYEFEGQLEAGADGAERVERQTDRSGSGFGEGRDRSRGRTDLTSTSVSRVLAAVSARDMLGRLEILTEQEKGVRSERVSLAAEGRGMDKIDDRDVGVWKFGVDRSVENCTQLHFPCTLS